MQLASYTYNIWSILLAIHDHAFPNLHQLVLIEHSSKHSYSVTLGILIELVLPFQGYKLASQEHELNLHH
jgi:hypothetical protein